MAETPLRGGSVLLRHGFDHAVSPDLLAGSFDGWSQLRAQGRAFHSDLAGSYDLWSLLRYDDIRAALQDYELFSSRSVQYLGDGPQRMLPESWTRPITPSTGDC
jgi:cytochrome P450